MTGNHYKYVLVGGGVASSAAVQAIRERDKQGAVLLVGHEINRPYRRPPLNNEYLLGKIKRADLFTLPDEWFVRNGVELRTGRHASHLDPTRHGLTLDSGEEIAFDRLLLATGASPRRLTVPGAELPNIFYLHTIEDADRLHHAIEKARRDGRPHANGRGRAVIIGAGLLGLELAVTFSQLGLHVDVLMKSAHPWPKFAGETAGRFVAHYLETRSISIYPQTIPLRLEGDGRVQRVVLSEKQSLDCDFVVPAIGVLPNKELTRSTALAAEKAILADRYARTSDPDIFAAGDCAAIFDPLFGKYRILDHAESAVYSGTLAGANMAGDVKTYDDVSRFDTRIFDLNVTVWGEARHVERRIVRGNPNLESADFFEISIASDGRIAKILAVNHSNEDDLLRELVRQRLNVTDKEEFLRDPTTDLRSLLRRLRSEFVGR